MNHILKDRPELIHVPVMAAQVVDALAPRDGCRYLDGTTGLGGHDQAILETAPGCLLCGLDRDGQALELARQRLAPFEGRFYLFQSRFGDFPEALENLGWERVDGALLDLGLSSLQLDVAARGFSFRSEGPLDMRMNQQSGEKKAWELVNRAPHAQLRDIFATLGEEPQAARIARHIIEARQKGNIDTTSRLAEIVWGAYPPAWRRSARRHPATRVFQALRMAVNDELGQLRQFLAQIWDWLAPGARLAIISFHSLEDRMVKLAMRQWAKREDAQGAGRLLHKKPIMPDDAEIARNPRSGSAKLRVIEKLES